MRNDTVMFTACKNEACGCGFVDCGAIEQTRTKTGKYYLL